VFGVENDLTRKCVELRDAVKEFLDEQKKEEEEREDTQAGADAATTGVDGGELEAATLVSRPKERWWRELRKKKSKK
jgi:hypothetical protein